MDISNVSNNHGRQCFRSDKVLETATGTVYPDFEAVSDVTELTQAIGALLMIVLVTAVLMLIICAVTWAITAANGQHGAATKARIGAWTALGTAIIAGAGIAWMNWLIDLGTQL